MKYVSFGTLFLLLLLLVSATVCEKLYGTAFAVAHFYGAPFFVMLWAVAALAGLAYLWQRRVQKRPATFLLHLSLMVILGGALTTYLFGQQGSVHLRMNEAPATAFTDRHGDTHSFPFSLALESFHLEYYPGTHAPMDFVSELILTDQRQQHRGKVAMNHIHSYRHYRFYQSQYDADGRGTTLSVSHDPYGIAFTYSGYALLLLSILLFFLHKGSRFRQLCRHPLLRNAAAVLCLAGWACAGCQEPKAPDGLRPEPASMQTEASGPKGYTQAGPRTLSAQAASELGKLYVYHNDRICPLQTLAREFTTKIYGRSRYRGLSAEQVLSGWIFFYDDWKAIPLIQIKDKKVRALLGLSGRYASLNDFADIHGYKLEEALRSAANVQERRGVEEANEKFNLISMVCTGSMLKLFPHRTSPAETPVWHSPADKLPAEMPAEEALFIQKSMNYLAEQTVRGNEKELIHTLEKIRKFQQQKAGNGLPSDTRIQAERLYNSLHYTLYIAIGSMLLGVSGFIYHCRRMIQQGIRPQTGRQGFPGQTGGKGWIPSALSLFVFLYLAGQLSLRGYVSGHLPMSNGFETMQCMAACSLLLPLCLQKRFPPATAFGFLLCGLSLMVARFSEANPPITPLMPVLASPLLSVHVMLIMVAYSLLAFLLFNGVTALVLYGSSKRHRAAGDTEAYTHDTTEIERLQLISRVLLYPAVFCLALGIFIGAVWANVSWGRYWGWDPKEVWALITMLVYAAALHPASLGCFRRPMFFHVFTILAFLCVLITYFGVNFLLGGMHSYAG